MKRILLAGPAVEPVSLSDAKAHMRVDAADEDTLISTLIVAARVAAEAEIRRVMISQSWRAFIETWPADGVELPVQPMLSVEAVLVWICCRVFFAYSRCFCCFLASHLS